MVHLLEHFEARILSVSDISHTHMENISRAVAALPDPPIDPWLDLLKSFVHKLRCLLINGSPASPYGPPGLPDLLRDSGTPNLINNFLTAIKTCLLHVFFSYLGISATGVSLDVS